MDRPIYLHVFDRELRTLVGAQFSDRDVCDIVYVGVLASKFCYIGNSNLAESFSEFPVAVKLVCELEKLGCAKVLTTTISKDEFIEGRKRLYHEVKDRYPMYFGGGDVLFPSRPQVLKDSTTAVLQANILLSIDKNEIPKQLVKKADDITVAIKRRDTSGITVGILNRMIELDRIEHFYTGLLVSQNYNKRYLDVMGGCLLKGLSWVNIFDNTSGGNYDYWLYYNIMDAAFIKYIKQKASIKEQAELIFALKENQYFRLFQSMLQDMITTLKDVNKGSLDDVRWEVLQKLKPRLQNLAELTPEGALGCLQILSFIINCTINQTKLVK